MTTPQGGEDPAPSGYNPLIAEHIGPPHAPFYVYLLIDPADEQVFYVGKGTGDRFRQHGAAAMLLADDAPAAEVGAKLARIHSIRQQGRQPIIEFARIRIPTEKEAYLVEAVLIDVLARRAAALTNVVRGHETSFGVVSLAELETELFAPPLDTQMAALLVILGSWTPDDDRELPRTGYGYRPGMTTRELYDSTRAWWVMGHSARSGHYRYAVAVFSGVTRGVWEIRQDSWRQWDVSRHGQTRVRWAFAAGPAPPEIAEAFVGRTGRRIPTIRPDGRSVFGSGSPIAYWPS